MKRQLIAQTAALGALAGALALTISSTASAGYTMIPARSGYGSLQETCFEQYFAGRVQKAQGCGQTALSWFVPIPTPFAENKTLQIVVNARWPISYASNPQGETNTLRLFAISENSGAITAAINMQCLVQGVANCTNDRLVPTAVWVSGNDHIVLSGTRAVWDSPASRWINSLWYEWVP